ncbi:hypothetical protein BOTCAL_0086g00340 [Botryotinia calthae]|uniref:Uncharacterized protein n=1 Tax=Botryotinia calthae TaxID=38488 RepID=A0A4Y8D7G3_9HELO|nr:hypothetical protein BOTCAL_0086g00340 [Botryotinia calthae]
MAECMNSENNGPQILTSTSRKPSQTQTDWERFREPEVRAGTDGMIKHVVRHLQRLGFIRVDVYRLVCKASCIVHLAAAKLTFKEYPEMEFTPDIEEKPKKSRIH